MYTSKIMSERNVLALTLLIDISSDLVTEKVEK